MKLLRAIAIALLATPSLAIAQEHPLNVREVLRAVDRSHPTLEAAEHNVKAAKASALSADGNWDPKLTLQSEGRPLGYYERRTAKAALKQRTPLWGTELFAGYKHGTGNFPAYDGERQTLSGGEVHAGLSVPLWRNGPIDDARATIQKARAHTKGSQCALRSKRLKLRVAGASAYYAWLASGQDVKIQQRLLQVAKERASALKQRVDLGSIPSILITDNARLVLERESKLVAAERYFARAALKLSLYLRDDHNNPVRVHPRRLPNNVPVPDLASLRPLDADVNQALKLRPEMCEFEQHIRAANVDVRLAENQVAPSLDATAKVLRDLGSGPDSLRPTELAVGIQMELPLLLRKARGNHRKAQALASELRAQRRLLADQIRNEVHQLRIDLEAYRKQLELAERQLAAAKQLAVAERDRFELGASDLVVVNIRELAEANAAREKVQAQVTFQQALTDYQLAIGAFTLL